MNWNYKLNAPDPIESTEFLCHNCQEVVDVDEMGGYSKCCPLPVCNACIAIERQNDEKGESE